MYNNPSVKPQKGRRVVVMPPHIIMKTEPLQIKGKYIDRKKTHDLWILYIFSISFEGGPTNTTSYITLPLSSIFQYSEVSIFDYFF